MTKDSFDVPPLPEESELGASIARAEKPIDPFEDITNPESTPEPGLLDRAIEQERTADALIDRMRIHMKLDTPEAVTLRGEAIRRFAQSDIIHVGVFLQSLERRLRDHADPSLLARDLTSLAKTEGGVALALAALLRDHLPISAVVALN